MYWALIPLNKGVKGAPTRARESKLVVPSVELPIGLLVELSNLLFTSFVYYFCTLAQVILLWRQLFSKPSMKRGNMRLISPSF